jgi:hypothetical protein
MAIVIHGSVIKSTMQWFNSSVKLMLAENKITTGKREKVMSTSTIYSFC